MKNNEIRQQILKELLENEPLTSSIEKLNQQLDHAGKEELGRLMGLVYTYGYESCINDTLQEMEKIYHSWSGTAAGYPRWFQRYFNVGRKATATLIFTLIATL